MIGTEDEFPVFARVTNIYVSQGKVVFFVLVLYTNSYDSHFHSYELHNTVSTKYIDYNQLFSFEPLHERLIKGQLVMCSVSTNGERASLANLKFTIGLLECSSSVTSLVGRLS